MSIPEDQLQSVAQEQLQSLVERVEQLEYAARRRTIVYSLTSIFLGALLIFSSIRQIRGTQEELGRSNVRVSQLQGRVEELKQARHFVILNPADGAVVGIRSSIQGKTPFPELKHYIVVTPTVTGVDYVQEPVGISSDGTWLGSATLGAVSSGAGQKFIIRGLATRSTLAAGPLTALPEDAIFSNSITVTRKLE